MKKIFLFMLLAICMAVGTPALYAQSEDDNKIYNSVEKMPTYPGGDYALLKYMVDNLRYPADAVENHEQGRVLVQFAVKPDGSIGEIRILRSVSPSIDKEAKRLITSLDKFIPGEKDGKPVSVWYTLPITFKL